MEPAGQESASLDTAPPLSSTGQRCIALDQQVGALTIELEKAAPAALPKGMGAMSSVVISREICDWQRFKNRRQVSSYTGLCPGEYSSGTKRVTGSVTKHGNGRLRVALVELAWRMVRFQPRYHAVQKRFSRPGKRRPSYWGAAQEGHCRCSSSAGCIPLEDFIPGAAHPRSSDLTNY